MSYTSIDTYESHIALFVTFIRQEYGLKTLNEIERSHVMGYGEYLCTRYEQGEIKASTAKNYLSAVNSALEQARQDTLCQVDPRDAGLPGRTYIATTDKSIPYDQHNSVKLKISERLACQLDLQRGLGLRFKESCLIDAKAAMRQAEKSGMVKITDGTKGGLGRPLLITSESQLEALRVATKIQGHDRSMIPENLSFREYQIACYNEIHGKMAGFHGERHTYANDRYLQLSGVDSPVRAGIQHGRAHYHYIAKNLGLTLNQAKQLDHTVRLQIATELGHARISITNNYLG